jgi:FlaA1/EpsC-like NDP-sugar epimerase
MIIGAGGAGQSIVRELSGNKKVKIKCFIDDDSSKIGQYLSGIHIVGDVGTIVNNAEKYQIDTIIFAIPTCSIARRSEILNICGLTKCHLKILPQLNQLENVSEFVPAIRKVEIEDLLGREVKKVDLESVMEYVKEQVVLVTGGGGTIGSELCRQIASHNPKQLIIFDIYENNAYEIQNELKRKFPTLDLVTLIGSVRDSKRMNYVFRTYKPDIVYHAAAHKHVPLMEDSPNESIKNNVFGTYKTAQCADRYGVKRFVLISTDKAVNPTNIMGASKRICEMIVQTFNEKSDTEFVAVRFGNVLGSNGSVIPLFKKQLEQGGPLTVTDPNIIRYFMTIPEAVSLVLQAGASAKGGEIFVLDMGQPVKILTLAENLIRLSGFEPYKDIGIVFTGLRPGEKLYEELLMSEEGLTATENELIHIGRPIDIDGKVLEDTLEEMRSVMYDESADIRQLVKRIVPTYQIPQKIQEKELVNA